MSIIKREKSTIGMYHVLAQGAGNNELFHFEFRGSRGCGCAFSALCVWYRRNCRNNAIFLQFSRILPIFAHKTCAKSPKYIIYKL